MVLECEPFFSTCPWFEYVDDYWVNCKILCFFLLTDDTASNSSNSQKVMLHLPVTCTYTCHSQVLMLHLPVTCTCHSQVLMLHLPVTCTCHSQVLMLHLCCFWIGLLELTEVYPCVSESSGFYGQCHGVSSSTRQRAEKVCTEIWGEGYVPLLILQYLFSLLNIKTSD